MRTLYKYYELELVFQERSRDKFYQQNQMVLVIMWLCGEKAKDDLMFLSSWNSNCDIL